MAKKITNCRPISVLPCFSKILERIIYDRLYSYLTNNKIPFKKQFCFRSGHSTDHALPELIDQICECFDEKKYFPGFFFDLSKAVDTVNHKISILGLLLFFIFINDLSLVSTFLSPIMLADDTNLFYSHNNVKILFKNANDEL